MEEDVTAAQNGTRITSKSQLRKMGGRDRIVPSQCKFNISKKIPRFSGFNSGICGINLQGG
jgi:hypothetical protein